jgi:mannitol/fructose-specific phosphotransferase system IIA component (Ntr-type)
MNEDYVRSIIDRLVEAGPYMFVTKDLILAHARPENGVNHLDYSIGIAPEGIAFEGGKRARILFLLVVEDQKKHMGILRDIRKAMAKPQQVDELVRMDNAKDVCEILRDRLLEV